MLVRGVSGLPGLFAYQQAAPHPDGVGRQCDGRGENGNQPGGRRRGRINGIKAIVISIGVFDHLLDSRCLGLRNGVFVPPWNSAFLSTSQAPTRRREV